RVVRLELSQACTASVCNGADQTCAAGRCRCMDVPPDRLAPWDGQSTPHGWSLARLDGASDPPVSFPLRAATYLAAFPRAWSAMSGGTNYNPATHWTP